VVPLPRPTIFLKALGEALSGSKEAAITALAEARGFLATKRPSPRKAAYHLLVSLRPTFHSPTQEEKTLSQ